MGARTPPAPRAARPIPPNGSVNTFQDGSAPQAVATGDINGDGLPDLAVAWSGLRNVAIYQGLPGGGFSNTPVTTLLLPAGAQPQDLILKDLDGDGRLDV